MKQQHVGLNSFMSVESSQSVNVMMLSVEETDEASYVLCHNIQFIRTLLLKYCAAVIAQDNFSQRTFFSIAGRMSDQKTLLRIDNFIRKPENAQTTFAAPL